MRSRDYTTFTDDELRRVSTVAREITTGWQRQWQEFVWQAERAEHQAATAERDLLEILAEIGRRETPTTEEMEDA